MQGNFFMASEDEGKAATVPQGKSKATAVQPVTMTPGKGKTTAARGPIDPRTHRRECTTLLFHSFFRLLLWNITISKLISALPYSKFSSALTVRPECNFRIRPPSTALPV